MRKDDKRMSQLGLIGCGSIAQPVISALNNGHIADWQVCAILARRRRRFGEIEVVNEIDAFIATDPDVIIDAAGPNALLSYGNIALSHCDVWSIGAAALADEDLEARLRDVAFAHGHQLRILPGAMGGLDIAAIMALDRDATFNLSIFRPARHGETIGQSYVGTAREACLTHPDETNVAGALALAVGDWSRVWVTLHVEATDSQRRIALQVNAKTSSYDAVYIPTLSGGEHPASQSILAALSAAHVPITVG
jgi:aspartate dehydrogenase